jgi:hypothetical protein
MDEEFIEQMQKEIDFARLNTDRANLSRLQQDAFLEKEEKSMIKEQLDLSDQITRIDYLLKGFSLQPDKEGNLVWTEPCSEDMKVFSPYGIQLIMKLFKLTSTRGKLLGSSIISLILLTLLKVKYLIDLNNNK